MRLHRLATLLLAFMAISIPASAEQVRVFVNIERAIVEAGLDKPSEEAVAPLLEEQAAIDAARTEFEAERDAFEANALFMVGGKREAQEKKLKATDAALEKREAFVQMQAEELVKRNRAAAMQSVQDALNQYLDLNQVDVIQPLGGTFHAGNTLMLDPAYDISPTITGLMQGAENSSVPPAPKAPAVIRYVNLETAFALTGAQDDLDAATSDYLDMMRDRMAPTVETYNELTGQLNSPVLSPNGRSALLRQRDDVAAELDTLSAERDTQLERLEAGARQLVRDLLVAALVNTEIAENVDIVRFYGAPLGTRDALIVANSDLDITAMLVESIMIEDEVPQEDRDTP